MNTKAQSSQATLERLPKVTVRELTVLELLAKGYTDHELGKILLISPWTVKHHRKNLMNKYKAKNAANLIYKAFKKQTF